MFKSEPQFDPAALEQAVLAFWEKEKIFQKSLAQTEAGEPFTFYDGPPFATGVPHYGHILASTIKDLIPRYQTMRGRYVRRRWGWDCHGLPIEEIVERKLGISGKKQIEEIGIEKFNATCRSMVLQFADEWRKMVRRIARWVEFDNSYKTMDRDYMESVWWAFKQIYDKGLIYEGRKVLLYCPRCETPISNFEVAMDNSYKEVTEEAVTVKFRLVPGQKIGSWTVSDSTYILAWTTTPWTLPGNVALAVGENIKYVEIKVLTDKGEEFYIVAQDRASEVVKNISHKYEIFDDPYAGSDLVGLSYEPLYEVPAVKSDKSYKVYAADFVTTEEGTGVVHTAVVYGEDDYALGVKVGLPVVPLLDEKGKFNAEAPEFLRGQYFKETEKFIKKDLESRGLLLDRKMHQHSYPHCWRCGNVLFYNALPAWFINIQKVKKDILKSNEKTVSWYPEHLKHGRYAKSVEAAPDWNISRNRYWGNPIPVWKCDDCKEHIVAGSINDLGLSRNTFYFARHGEAKSNTERILDSYPEKGEFDLSKKGVELAKKLAKDVKAKGGVDLIFTSDLYRARHTAQIVGDALGVKVVIDARLREFDFGPEWNGKPYEGFDEAFPYATRRDKGPKGGETGRMVEDRMLDFVRETNGKYDGKKILVVSHGDPLRTLQQYFGSERQYPRYAELFSIDVSVADLHRPYIDEIVLDCKKCGGKAHRTPEIFDSWVEAGSMPFAEYHYPFEQKEVFESRQPAQFVSEYIAQTRAWFYVMHVISEIVFGKAPFENVVTTGTILAEDGSKMSKSKNNFPDPWVTIDKYGVDALRFYLMNSTVMQADNMNFSLRDLETVYRKVVLLSWNVHNYFLTYAAEAGWKHGKKKGEETLLDKWILARTQELVNTATESLDGYDTVKATSAIEKYVDDLSTWYLRRSRGRTDEAFFETLYEAQLTLAKVMAPAMPYLSEIIHKNLLEAFGGEEAESVHLASWPKARKLKKEEEKLVEGMELLREAASVGLASRQKLKIPVRQPLSRVFVAVKPESGELSEEMKEILLAELNIRNFDSKLEKEGEAFPGVRRVANVYIDSEVTPELKLEGYARNMERFVQEMRKAAGLKVGEMKTLTFETEDEELAKALKIFDKKKTYVSEIIKGEASKELDLEGRKIKFEL